MRGARAERAGLALVWALVAAMVAAMVTPSGPEQAVPGEAQPTSQPAPGVSATASSIASCASSAWRRSFQL